MYDTSPPDGGILSAIFKSRNLSSYKKLTVERCLEDLLSYGLAREARWFWMNANSYQPSNQIIRNSITDALANNNLEMIEFIMEENYFVNHLLPFINYSYSNYPNFSINDLRLDTLKRFMQICIDSDSD
jgi:hypothetical protein